MIKKRTIVLGVLIPFLGTLLGSSMVFLMKDKLNVQVEKFLLGFAIGFALMMVLDIAFG